MNKIERSRLVALIIVGAIGLGLLTISSRSVLSSEPTAIEATETVEPTLQEKLLRLTMEELNSQQEIEKEIAAEYEAGDYTFDDSLVVLDPYGLSPLTAIAMFRTEEPSKISLHISAELCIDEVNFTFEEFKTEHVIPILGLYAGQVNQVLLTAETDSGKVHQTTIEIETGESVDEIKFRSNKYKLWDIDAYGEGLNFSNQIEGSDNGKWAFDSQGNCRWYFTENVSGHESIFNKLCQAVEFDGHGCFFVACGATTQNAPVVYFKLNYTGKILGVWFADNSLHHEITATNKNTLIALGNNPSTIGSEQDVVYELDLTTGEMIHFLDYKNVLMRSRKCDSVFDTQEADWAHLNAVVPYYDDRIIVSSNHQSTVICNDWDGNISWMLCNPEGYPEIYKDYILTPIGSDFEYAYGQHCVTIINDELPDDGLVDILLFDNGRDRNSHTGEPDENYSRMVVYRIDEKNMTVEQLWSYGKERQELYSPWCSSAALLNNGNYLGLFNVGGPSESYRDHPAYVEVSPDGSVVWELHQESTGEDPRMMGYRVERLPIYSEMSKNLHWGEEPVNLIPATILAQYGYGTPHVIDENRKIEEVEASTSESNESIIWSFTIDDWKVQKELHSIEMVPQYLGDPVETPHDNIPSQGAEYLLLNLTVTKNAPGSSTFLWSNLSLSLNGQTYYRVEDDSFLTKHGYERLPGTDLKLGSKTGWICMEIPANADLDNANLVYQEANVSQATPLP